MRRQLLNLRNLFTSAESLLPDLMEVKALLFVLFTVPTNFSNAAVSALIETQHVRCILFIHDLLGKFKVNQVTLSS